MVPWPTTYVASDKAEELQRNLVYYLAIGVGAKFPPSQSRAFLATRLLTLCQGNTAVYPALLEHIALLLYAGIAHPIPERGTVGASGDLTPLAHAALGIMGEGELRHNGQWQPAGEVLKALGMLPYVGTQRGLGTEQPVWPS